MRSAVKKFVYGLLLLFVFFNIICAVQAYHFTRFVEGYKPPKPSEMGVLEKTDAALFGLPLPKSTVDDTLDIPHTNVALITEDSMHLAAWHLQHNKNDSVIKGTILMFHGHGSSRCGIIAEAEVFYNDGWNVFMTDFRSHGQSEGSVCAVGYFEKLDVKAAYDFIKQTGEKHIELWGVSMGAATIATAMYNYPEIEPEKVILEMPFADMRHATEGFLHTLHMPDEPLGVLLTFWGGAELGFWAFNHCPSEYVKKITCPVLLQWGRLDTRVTERETDTIFSNLASVQKSLVVYEYSGHESLCHKEHNKWMQQVTTFLDK